MNKIYLPKFNHEITLLGGQSFSWDLINPDKDEYLGFTSERAIKARFDNEYMYWQTYPVQNDELFIKKYFRTDIDYENIICQVSKDKLVCEAMSEMPNIRLLKQPLDQTILSFIISANNNIKAIRRSVRKLADMLGEKIKVGGRELSLFPSTEALAEASIETLRESRIGFRAKYIKKSAQMLLDGDFSEKLDTLDEDEARELLIQLPGVGNKVADCVLVFALGFDNLTPIDVWTRRAFTDLYNLPEDWNYEKMREWVKENFHGYASWANEFIFEWYRKR
jgi:N-glycosylase/DNA lyase